MRVVLLGPYPPPHGGVQTNLTAIRAYLLERGEECAVINLHRFRSGRGEAVFHPESALEALWLLARLRADVIHLHIGGDLTPRLLGLCLVCCAMPGRKAVLTFHSGGYPSSEAGRRAAPFSLRGFVFRRFERIIAVNLEIAEMFARFGVAPERVRTIAPHALPPAQPHTEMPAPLREFFGAHSPVLLSVGLLEPEYDLPLQIEALGAIRARFPNAGLALIGAGSLEADLRRRIAEQPWAEHILLCGDVPHPGTLAAIAAADVLLRTTLYDGDSVSVREALHLGTPVVATDNGMRPAGVRLISASNAAALCRAVADAVQAPRTRPAAKRDTGQENIEAVYKLYRELTR
ncbi:MAG TPA: glycosyltransferase [Bryobacteraceae bacterium]|nr:glycosyltransferase [Bryobacteraceae bacterium]HPU72784.1 glycosyltransferase [Bryobacteraceae bacterium]